MGGFSPLSTIYKIGIYIPFQFASDVNDLIVKFNGSLSLYQYPLNRGKIYNPNNPIVQHNTYKHNRDANNCICLGAWGGG